MIEIKEFKSVEQGACKARFNLYFPKLSMELRECAYFESNGKKWVSMPSKPYDKDGIKKYFPLVQFSDEKKKQLDQFVFAELEKLMPKTVQKPEVQFDDGVFF